MIFLSSPSQRQGIVSPGLEEEISVLRLQDEVLAIFLQFSKSTLFLVASHLKQEDIHIGHSPEDVGDFPGVVD